MVRLPVAPILYYPPVVPCFGGKRPSTDSRSLNRLEQLAQAPALKTRETLYRQLKDELQRHETPKERQALDRIRKTLLALAQATASRVPEAVARIEARGYRCLFADYVLMPESDTRAILRAFDYDPSEIRTYIQDAREGENWLTAGDLLAISREEACFIKGTGTCKGYLLFSSPSHRPNPAQFWHELFHAVQHEQGLYKPPLYTGLRDFLKRELEASEFVIDQAKILGLSVRERMLELRIWSLRAQEYQQAGGGRFAALA